MSGISFPDVAATESFARQLARIAADGDCITLEGPLGAGKTVLARAFIRALCGPDTEVTSPTFNLVQRYDAPGMTLWHADFYRIESEEALEEVGLSDMLMSGITLIEWPQVAARLLPANRLALALEAPGEGRLLRCNAPQAWYSRAPELFKGVA